ncbi:MAG TPA: DDE-type integrase/transposase/recombinase [Pyrinomonadaceae bacterium]|nr:DDE-type integrase/transposase/recombinase [Pyrinomonadaceae bacterium]
MLNKDELMHWCQRLGLSQEARNVIDQVRLSDPARRVQSGTRNVSGSYPSKKMNVTIQFESHRVELADVYEMEYDDDVIEYYDQPPTFKLEYFSTNGRRQVVMHTPDYFAIRKETAGWDECKTEAQLEELSEKNPNRYCRGEDGEWRCPPGEAYAEKVNCYYRVRSSSKINWIFQRNIQFLEDYLRVDQPEIDGSAREAVLAAVAAEPSITLEEVFVKTDGVASRDDIYQLIATGEVYVDLKAAPLAEPKEVRVFPNKDTALAYAHIVEVPSNAVANNPRFIDLAVGSAVEWNNRAWKIANVGDKLVSLVGENNTFTELPLAAFELLVKEGRVSGVVTRTLTSANEGAAKILSEANEDDFRMANIRANLVCRRLRGEPLPDDNNVPERTLRYWVAQYREMEAKYGNGYLGLLPHIRRRGPRGSQLPEATWDLITEFIENDYETLKQKKKYEVWVVLKNVCDKRGVIAPSYKTFARAVRRRSGYRQTLKRKGRRAAYGEEIFYWELDLKTPRHGDRPFEIGHIDHTELDVESPSSQTGRSLGRPWLTILTDAYSRRILAVYVTFDSPSYRSCMMVLRQCVRLHGRLPQIIVVDGGAEFRSTYFDTLLARYECIKKTRPPAKARFGSVCERLFGTTNTQFIHNLRGNTQITKNVRQVTKSVNPKSMATWPLGNLYDRICEYASEVYDTISHPALGESPRNTFIEGIARTGKRPHRYIPYDEDFLMWTLPTTPLGTAKMVAVRGVKIHHIFYWSDAFRDRQLEGTRLPIRYDPFDVGIAYAFVGKRWVRCYSEYYSVFHGRSEKELMIATKELRALKASHSQQFSVSAKRLADFLESVEAEEVMLMQRLRDTEGRKVFEKINGASVTANAKEMEFPRSATEVDEAAVDSSIENEANTLEIYEEF